MKYTANQAAKVTGKAVPTITRAIKSGKLSANRDGKNLVIDAAELFRVFPPAKTPSNDVITKSHNKLQHETPESNNNNTMLQREIEMLREMLEREKDTVRDLRTRLDSESDERRRLTAMLTDQRHESKKLDANQPWWKARIW